MRGSRIATSKTRKPTALSFCVTMQGNSREFACALYVQSDDLCLEGEGNQMDEGEGKMKGCNSGNAWSMEGLSVGKYACHTGNINDPFVTVCSCISSLRRVLEEG